MQLHQHFEWDENKAEKNLKKHKVSFEDAAYVLADENADKYHIEEFDEDHSDEEDRYITTGSHPDDRSIILRISWKDASTQRTKITRIISCRAATTAERTRYAKEISAK
jgi:uncharacterized DUF497 family protein